MNFYGRQEDNETLVQKQFILLDSVMQFVEACVALNSNLIINKHNFLEKLKISTS